MNGTIPSRPGWFKPLVTAFALGALFMASGVNAAPPGDGSSTVTQSPAGAFVVGDPAAPHRLIIWASYTCSHCADFDAAAMATVRERYVAPGHIAVELRNVVRDPFDMTAGLLARCGGAAKFFGNHTQLMATQSRWLGQAQNASETEQAAWTTGTPAQRMVRISRGVGLDRIMSQRGVTLRQQARCLADRAAMDKMAAMTRDAVSSYGVRGTPSFAIDGKLVDDVFGWEALKPRLDALIAAK